MKNAVFFSTLDGTFWWWDCPGYMQKSGETVSFVSGANAY